MNACNIEPKIKPADQPLQDYQVGFDNLKLNWLVKFSSNNPIKILSLGKLMISRFFEETERSLVFICIGGSHIRVIHLVSSWHTL